MILVAIICLLCVMCLRIVGGTSENGRGFLTIWLWGMYVMIDVSMTDDMYVLCSKTTNNKINNDDFELLLLLVFGI